MLEMYDFLITGMMFPYMAHLFFPLEDKISVLLAGSLTFFVGFLMRPVGAILFGYIGDVYGRKRALLLSIFGMALATGCTGILPTYAEISLFAPLLFVVLRLIQGACMGGEGQGSSVFVLEHYRGIKPGATGSLLATSNGMAGLLAFFISMIVTSQFAPESAWRYCYFFGASLGFVGLYLRSFIKESPAFLKENRKNAERPIPLFQILKERKLNVVNVVLFVGMLSCLTYTGFTFINLFLNQFMHLSPFFSLSCAAFQTILAMMMVVFFGRLCDRIGLYPTVSIVMASLIFLIFPAHWLLASGTIPGTFLSLVLFAIPAGGVAGCAPHLVASSFPTKVRYTGAAFSNNLAQALLGGIQPFLAIYLIKTTDILWSPAMYPCGLACVYVLFLLVYRKKLKSFTYI